MSLRKTKVKYLFILCYYFDFCIVKYALFLKGGRSFHHFCPFQCFTICIHFANSCNSHMYIFPKCVFEMFNYQFMKYVTSQAERDPAKGLQNQNKITSFSICVTEYTYIHQLEWEKRPFHCLFQNSSFSFNISSPENNFLTYLKP